MKLSETDPTIATPAKQVLLAGLDQQLTQELSNYLTTRGLSVQSCAGLDSATPEALERCDLAFCDIRQAGLAALLRAVSVPVVVVSRLPEVDDWLDAMEAGAADYCAEPIEQRQLDWILESNLERRRQAVAAA